MSGLGKDGQEPAKIKRGYGNGVFGWVVMHSALYNDLTGNLFTRVCCIWNVAYWKDSFGL